MFGSEREPVPAPPYCDDSRSRPRRREGDPRGPDARASARHSSWPCTSPHAFALQMERKPAIGDFEFDDPRTPVPSPARGFVVLGPSPEEGVSARPSLMLLMRRFDGEA